MLKDKRDVIRNEEFYVHEDNCNSYQVDWELDPHSYSIQFIKSFGHKVLKLMLCDPIFELLDFRVWISEIIS